MLVYSNNMRESIILNQSSFVLLYEDTSKTEALCDKVQKEMIAKKSSGADKCPLQMHTTFYKNSYAKMKGCSLHDDVEARVSSLLRSMEDNDRTIIARIENVKGNTNMLKDFDETVNYVLTIYPMTRNRISPSQRNSKFG